MPADGSHAARAEDVSQPVSPGNELFRLTSGALADHAAEHHAPPVGATSAD
jgi:hypothetical protein